MVKETEVVRCVRVSLECLANAAVGSPTVNLSTELAGNASISTTTRATLMLLQVLENNRPTGHQYSIVLIRHRTVFSRHAVIDATVASARAS